MRSFLWFLNRLLILTILTGLIYAAMTRNHAHSKAIPMPGFYDEDSNTPIKDFMQPDSGNDTHDPFQSCCGQYDAYWADEYEIDAAGDFYAIVTDPRVDDLFVNSEGESRVHVPVGTRVLVTDRKIITPGERGQPLNNTGHGWVWLSSSNFVICYLRPAGL